MARVRFVFCDGFLAGPPAALRAAPRRKVKLESQWYGLYRTLCAIERRCDKNQLLRWSHLQEAGHVRQDYWPPVFGAFLAALQGATRFGDVKGLDDEDPQGYLARYVSDRFALQCAVLYTERPSPRMAFLNVGGKGDCDAALKALRDAETARDAIAVIRSDGAPPAEEC